MAEQECMPDPIIAQTDLPGSDTNDRFPEVTRKTSAACCELHSRIRHQYIPLSGEWLTRAGFLDGMPIKIRVMPDCIVITPQNTRELWGCLEGLSIIDINKRRVGMWLKTFPYPMNDTGNEPVIRRNSNE